MAMYMEDPEFEELRMFRAVLDVLESNNAGQESGRSGFLDMGMDDDLDYEDVEDFENGVFVDYHGNIRSIPSLDQRYVGNGRKYFCGILPPPLHHFPIPMRAPPPVTKLKPSSSIRPTPSESHAEIRAKILEEEKKAKEKAEKKRLKKQKQKERKRQEKLEKEKQNSEESLEVKDESPSSKKEKDVNINNNSSKNGPCKDGDDVDSNYKSCSEEEEDDGEQDSDATDTEELDFTSTFVSKAASIAQRKLEQKAKPEKKEKKKPLAKEEVRAPKEETNTLNEDKESKATPSNPSLEDYIKISTELALLGNRFASAGQFDIAVQHFTDAIKYNPREYRLFGNRAFCFEKMQEYEKALTDAELSLNICPGWVKGLFRKGRALAGLKRYEEALQAFREVMEMDSSSADAAQEIMRVQITQLMEYGYSWEQCSNALIHGSMDKALEVLSRMKGQPGTVNGSGPVELQPSGCPAPKALTGNPPSANRGLPAQRMPERPVQNTPHVRTLSKILPDPTSKTLNQKSDSERGLFPIWVGNLVQTVTATVITDLFSRVGNVHSVKLLSARKCAFVNFTNQDDCNQAISQYHGHELMGMKISVRYPDKIPRGMGMSQAALTATEQPVDGQKECYFWRNMGCVRPSCPYRHTPENRGIDRPPSARRSQN